MKPHISRERLSAHAAGELPTEEQGDVATHLQVCPDCRARYEDLRRVEQALALLVEAEPAPELLLDLRRRLGSSPARSGHWRWGVAVAVSVSAAAVVLLWPHAPRRPSAPVLVATRHPYVVPVEPPRSNDMHVITKGPQSTPVRTAAATKVAYVLPVPSPVQRRPRRQESPQPHLAALLAHVEAAHPSVPASPEVALDMSASSPAPPAETAADPEGGIILLLGDPLPARPSSQCHLEVTLPDGNTSILDRAEERDSTGQLRTARVSLQNLLPTPGEPNKGG